MCQLRYYIWLGNYITEKDLKQDNVNIAFLVNCCVFRDGNVKHSFMKEYKSKPIYDREKYFPNACTLREILFLFHLFMDENKLEYMENIWKIYYNGLIIYLMIPPTGHTISTKRYKEPDNAFKFIVEIRLQSLYQTTAPCSKEPTLGETYDFLQIACGNDFEEKLIEYPNSDLFISHRNEKSSILLLKYLFDPNRFIIFK